jgi:two-component system response regulator
MSLRAAPVAASEVRYTRVTYRNGVLGKARFAEGGRSVVLAGSLGTDPPALDLLFCQGKYRERKGTDAPKLVLLDLKLPKVDGLEVLRTLKQDERTRSIPVVVVTSSGEDPDIRAAYDLGANSYVVKPVDFEAFSEAVIQLGLYWLLLNQPPK